MSDVFDDLYSIIGEKRFEAKISPYVVKRDIERLEESIKDEEKDFWKYSDIAEHLRRVYYVEEAKEIDDIAKDEERHSKKIRKILERVRK